MHAPRAAAGHLCAVVAIDGAGLLRWSSSDLGSTTAADVAASAGRVAIAGGNEDDPDGPGTVLTILDSDGVVLGTVGKSLEVSFVPDVTLTDGKVVGLADAVKWAVDHGIAKADEVCIAGYSYGANDPRAKRSESDQIVAAMKANGIPVGYVVFPDEGHFFHRPENNQAFFAVAEAFLSVHIGVGGRGASG